MTRLTQTKTNFTAGEVSPELLGRGDLRAYENGASNLTNLFIHPTGGVTRRAGLYHLSQVAGAGRLVPFEFNTEQTYLLVFTDMRVTVFRDGVERAAFDTDWTLAQLDQIAWTQSADTLLVSHPDLPPKLILRNGDTDWSLEDWPFVEEEDGASREPFYRYAAPDVTLTPSATSGSITLTASADVFTPDHEGARLRVGGKQVVITSVSSTTTVAAEVKQTLTGTSATTSWSEAAFSDARGWPIAVVFHQDRLVIGGAKSLPNRLWLSKSGDIWNFDLGEGLDDEAIEFAILSDQVNAIRAVFSGRHLQVFTSGGEWMVTGDPLTPATLQIRRQTRVGSATERWVSPVDVDGATLFAARTGQEIREFLFTDLEQAYQSNDLALVSRHLINSPVSLAFDQRRRLLFCCMSDGSLAALTLYRSEQVAAWTRQQTAGNVLSVAVAGDDVFLLTERDGAYAIELFDDGAATDAALTGTDSNPRATWSGLTHLEGKEVTILADGVVHASQTVTGGQITIDPPALSIEVGLPYTHIVEPLPVSAISNAGAGRAYRVVEATFRLQDSQSLRVDLGQGLREIPLRELEEGAVLGQPPPPTSGDIRVRAHGWRKDLSTTPWRIEQSVPLPFTLLSVSLELKVNN
ncbi:MAG: hypothetical protein AAF556_02855 [Pseudomonadota bacterium]